jgi:hypothetical protein
MPVNLDYCTIHHRIFHIRLTRQSFENSLKNVRRNPIPVTPKHRIPLAKLNRQIPPGTARPRNPKHPFNEHQIVPASATRITLLPQAMRLNQ